MAPACPESARMGKRQRQEQRTGRGPPFWVGGGEGAAEPRGWASFEELQVWGTGRVWEAQQSLDACLNAACMLHLGRRACERNMKHTQFSAIPNKRRSFLKF